MYVLLFLLLLNTPCVYFYRPIIIYFFQSKRAKDLLRCQGRTFRLFNAIGTLLEGHKATGKYAKGAIVGKTNQSLTSSSPLNPKTKRPSTLSSPIINKTDQHLTLSSTMTQKTNLASPSLTQEMDPLEHGFSSPPSLNPSLKSHLLEASE